MKLIVDLSHLPTESLRLLEGLQPWHHLRASGVTNPLLETLEEGTIHELSRRAAGQPARAPVTVTMSLHQTMLAAAVCKGITDGFMQGARTLASAGAGSALITAARTGGDYFAGLQRQLDEAPVTEDEAGGDA